MDRSRLHDKHHRLPARALSALVEDARARTLALVADLDDHQLDVPHLDIVNPFRWELGHVAFFHEAFVLRVLDRTPPLLPGGDELYDSFEVDHPDRWTMPMPSRQDTLAYMGRVLELATGRLRGRQPGAEETYLHLLGVLHEDMHGEAFCYMRQTLGYAPPRLDGASPEPPAGGPWPGDAEIPGGTYRIGAGPEAPFVFDNEKWEHDVVLAPYRIARAPVTNAEFAAFVDDGGYERRECWSPKGWAWRARRGAQNPIYWSRERDGWQRRWFDRRIPLAPHAPVVHVSWYEAEAYCRWAGRRLPTEAEWEVAASAEPGTGRRRRYPWGDEPPSPEHAALDARALDCADVGAFAAGDSAFGCRQMLGNVWEWTASPFYPFPGYVVDFPYVEYSAPWFGFPKVLRGGAWATRSRLVHNTYRNFFLPARNDVLAGFRTCAP